MRRIKFTKIWNLSGIFDIIIHSAFILTKDKIRLKKILNLKYVFYDFEFMIKCCFGGRFF